LKAKNVDDACITCHSCFLASNSSSSSSDDIPAAPPPFILICGCVLILFLVADRNFLNTAYETKHAHDADVLRKDACVALYTRVYTVPNSNELKLCMVCVKDAGIFAPKRTHSNTRYDRAINSLML